MGRARATWRASRKWASRNGSTSSFIRRRLTIREKRPGCAIVSRRSACRPANWSKSFPQPRVARRARSRRERNSAGYSAATCSGNNCAEAPQPMAPAEGQCWRDAAGIRRRLERVNPGPPIMNYRQMQTPQRLVAELSMAKMDRAIYSERQLYEQMVDFWFNHFKVFAGKGQDRWLLTSYRRRDAIRKARHGQVPRSPRRRRRRVRRCSFISTIGRAPIRTLPDRLQQRATRRAAGAHSDPLSRTSFPSASLRTHNARSAA